MDNELNPTLGGTDLLHNLITKPSTTTTSGSPSGYFVATGVPFPVDATAAALSRVALVPFGGRTFERGWQRTTCGGVLQRAACRWAPHRRSRTATDAE